MGGQATDAWIGRRRYALARKDPKEPTHAPSTHIPGDPCDAQQVVAHRANAASSVSAMAVEVCSHRRQGVSGT